MNFLLHHARHARLALAFVGLLAAASPLMATSRDDDAADDRKATVMVVGIVRDEQNAIALPGVPVEVVGTAQTVYTDVDGKYVLRLSPGTYDLKISLDGYRERTVKVEALAATRALTVDVPLAMNKFAEEVTVTGQVVEAESSTAAAQLTQRKNASVITDNVGSQEMRANGDSDAAAAMQRVTGLSVVDNSFVFVRGLGERYSNTTLGGSVVPTTEPDKKVVPLDLFPTALLDSVQVAKTYSADKSAEFAGGLVQIVPAKIPNQPVLDLGYGLNYYETATGKNIPFSPLGNRDWLGYDDGARALPAGFPAGKVVRRGIYTPDVGYSRDQITEFGRLLENRWLPAESKARPGQNWNVAFGNRFGKLGIIGSVTHSYKEQYVEENRRFYRVDDGGGLEAVTNYDFRTGTQKAQVGVVANVAYQFTPSHRLAVENLYTHSGKDEGRYFEGPNTENNFIYRNNRLAYVEEGLFTNAVSGEHFLKSFLNSRIDWRASVGRAKRNEPDLRETLYQGPLSGAGPYVLADESQSGFRLFQDLEDETIDVSLNWSNFGTVNGRPLQLKFGPSYTRRTRDFSARRFHYIPTNAAGGPALTQSPEAIFTTANIGPYFRFNEETRPVDAYDAELTTAAFYGMGDVVLSNRARLVAGVRVEQFKEEVNTFDPFGLFVDRVTATLDNTDIFPGINMVYALKANMNVRAGYSQTVNRPEFRELASFEFTDVVGNRAVRGNPNLKRALIQNVDARWEMFGRGRGVFAVSGFYKHFQDPIERVIFASAQPLASFENADSARNFGLELELARELTRHVYVSANYTFVDSTITLSNAARQTQTSQERALAGQSKNLLNLAGEVTFGGFATRVLYNFFDDRISDVGASGAPDIIEKGRGSLDVVVSQRVGRMNVKLSLDNLTDAPYLFSQGGEDQRRFTLGRTVGLSVGFRAF